MVAWLVNGHHPVPLLRLLFLLLLLLVPAGEGALARSHGWDRDVGQRASRRLTRSERRRFTFGAVRDVQLDAAQVERRIESLRGRDGVRVNVIGRGDHGNPIYRVDIPARSGGQRSRPVRVVVSSWIHGDETVGPVAALGLVDHALKNARFRQRFDLSVLVKIDPFGTRNNPDGVNLNRAFVAGRWTAETLAIRRSLAPERGQIDLFVDLHGAGRAGFFLIRGQDDGNLSRRILGAMPTATLLDATGAQPWVGPYKLHSLGAATSNNPGTFKGWMIEQGAPYSYTLEAPRTLAPARQTAGMLRLLRSTLENTARHGRLDRAWPRGAGSVKMRGNTP